MSLGPVISPRTSVLERTVAALQRSLALLAGVTLRIGNPIDLTAQTLAISATNIGQFARAGMHRVSAVLEVTTGGGSDRTVTVTIGWTDRVGATSKAVISVFSGATTDRTQARIEFRASGDTAITYTTSVAGTLGSAPVYALTVRAERVAS